MSMDVRLVPVGGGYGVEERRDFVREAVSDIMNRREVLDPNRDLRRGLKGSGAVVSLGANASYFPIVLNAGICYAARNFISFYVFDLWALDATGDDVLPSGTEAELELFQRNAMRRCFQVSLTVAALALALLAETPLALPALDYDGSFRVLAMGSLYLGASILTLRSIQLWIQGVIGSQKCILGERGKKIEEARGMILSGIDQFREKFLGLSDKMTLVCHLNAFRGNRPIDQVDNYLSKTLEYVGLDALVPSLCYRISKGVVEGAAKVSGLWITTSLEVALVMYTSAKVKQHIDNDDGVAAVFTTVTVGAGLWLNVKAIVGTTARIAGAFFDCISCKRVKGLAEQLRFKTTIFLRVLGLLINEGTFGSSRVIWGDFFKNDEGKKAYFVNTLCAAYFLLAATGTLDMIDGAVAKRVLAAGTIDEREIMQLDLELGRLRRVYEKCSRLDLAVTLNNLPFAIKNRLLEKVDLSREEIEGFIGTFS